MMVAVEPGARAVIVGSRVPWRVLPAPPEVVARAALSAHLSRQFGRQLACGSNARAGVVLGDRGERVLSVRLHDKCEHEQIHWEWKTCGHVWCKMCNGFVHPGSKVSLKGPADVIKCNRKWHVLTDYKHIFRENTAGSGRLTIAMRKALGDDLVAPPEDILYSPTHDLLKDKVYERKKKEAKDRDTFLNHYAPKCSTFTYAQAQYQQRSMEHPYGDPGKGPLREAVLTDTKLAMRVCSLA